MKPSYEELEQQLAESHRALRAETTAHDSVKMQLEKMAEENAGLKDINAWCKTDAFKNMYREFKTAEAIGCHDVDCMHDAMLTALMHAPEAPATDAFLAEVRAQESAPLVRALTVIANSEQHDGETVVCDFDTLISVAAGALRDHYAAQLRKGVQS